MASKRPKRTKLVRTSKKHSVIINNKVVENFLVCHIELDIDSTDNKIYLYNRNAPNK